MTLTLSNLNTLNLFEHEKLFQSLSPEAINSTLTAALLYDQASKKVSIAMKDSLASIKLDIESDSVLSDPKEDFAIFFEYSKLMYILRSYTVEDLATLKIVASYDLSKETSSFVITCKGDKLSLPHMVMTESQRDDYITLDILAPKDLSTYFSWADLDDSQRRDFTLGISSSLSFLDTDEKKNNAVAVYPDKIVSNDAKAVFVYRMDSNISLPTDWIPIHKRAVRVVSSLLSSSLLENLYFNSSYVYLSTSVVNCKMNNSISNIAPPTEDDLINISSEEKIIDVSIEDLKNTSSFFSGFYSSTSMNPLKITFEKKEMIFTLQDSGLADFGSCNIERRVDCEPFSEGEYTIINDSLKIYLSRVLATEEKVSMWGQGDKPAVKLSTLKMDVYLARLK